MRSSGKQPAVHQQINQMGLLSSYKSGTKRKAPLSPLAPVRSFFCIYFDGIKKVIAAGVAAPARTEAERTDKLSKELSNLHTKNSALICCHFDSKGELLATSGHGGKVLVWDLKNHNVYSGEGHVHHVTDIHFRRKSTVFATSSFDRIVKIWDAAKPSNPIQNLVGHVEHVMSVDFHPRKVGLLSSCDSNDDIIMWDANKGDSKHIFKGNVNEVRSICWDFSGNYLASVSEDSARIWCIREGKCLHKLCSSYNKFQSCTFHPEYNQVLVICSFEFLELWNPIYQRSITVI